MMQPNLQDLKYGIIYLYCDRRLSSRSQGIEDVVNKLVRPMQVEWVNEPGREDLLLIARRFNVGNIGHYATVSLSLSLMNNSGVWLEAIHHFADVLMGLDDMGDGDIVLSEEDFGAICFDMCPSGSASSLPAPQDHTRVEASRKGNRWARFHQRLRNIMTSVKDEIVLCDESQDKATVDYCKDIAEPELDILQEEENDEVLKIEQERKQALERIKREIVNYIAHYHDDPQELMKELLRGKVVVGQPGRVLVNGDMKIVLPEYDEMEIKMPALCRTLYILFMKNRKQGNKGIVLKNMDEFRDEILEIYGLVKPGASERRVKQSAGNLCDPFSDSLNQTISRINRCIKNVITDKELAKAYTITGMKGQPYSIALAPEYIELPRAVTGA